MVDSLYDIYVEKMDGSMEHLEDYKGDLLLVVNTASRCGYTPQFGGLEKLYKKYKDKGFKVLGFPCNQFLRQDPGSNTEILNFCQSNYGVSFPMFAKINVRGRKQSDLFHFLIHHSPVRKGKRIKWNFEKFLINRNGEILNRYLPRVTPEYIDKDIEMMI